MNRVVLLLGILQIGALLFDCAPKVVPVEKTTPETLTRETQVFGKEPWQVEWEKTLEAARKESKVVVYTTWTPPVRSAVSESFYRNTGITMDAVVGRGAEIATKLISERRYGLSLADVYIGGTGTMVTDVKPKGILAPLEPILFLPEVLDKKLWYKNTLPWLDKDRLILVTRMMAGGSQVDVAFNTNISRKKELQSWYDLLNPKFKGNMNMQDPTTGGKAEKFIPKAVTYYGLDLDYMKALVKQEPVLTRDNRIQIEWVVRGKHIISILPESIMYDEFKDAGAPLDGSILKETKDVLGGGSSAVTLVDRAPHPNAARLFINWFLSKEGQTIFSRAYNIQSARMDTPTDHLAADVVRKPGVEYIIETEEDLLQIEKFRPIILEIFGPLIR